MERLDEWKFWNTVLLEAGYWPRELLCVLLSSALFPEGPHSLSLLT